VTIPASSAPADIDGEATALLLSLAVDLFVDAVLGPAEPEAVQPDASRTGG
jgi:hypothetical protein